jgi:CubicO group peptidase (beta-lactamase class C family)
MKVFIRTGSVFCNEVQYIDATILVYLCQSSLKKKALIIDNKKMKKIGIFICIVAASYSMLGQVTQTTNSHTTTQSKDSLPINVGLNPIFDNNAAIEQWLKENKVPTLGLGIIESGELKQIKVFGEISKGNSAPYNTIFNVASLTKPVTAMVALKLASLGQWNIDEPVYKYWIDPDIANDPRNKKITTRLILSHQTGFPNWRWMNENKKLSFQFEPGTSYQYSGEGLEYLRKALENKFKKSLQQLADELIFTPLNMNDTRYIWDKKVDTTRLALGYDPNGNVYKTIKNTTPNAADDLLTTIEDYSKFLINVMNGEGLSKQLFEDMMAHQVATKNGKHFGLGFEIYNFDDGNLALSHGGADKGVQTIVFIFPKTKQGLLIFTNVDDGYKVYEKLLLHYLGHYGKQIFDIETK